MGTWSTTSMSGTPRVCFTSPTLCPHIETFPWELCGWFYCSFTNNDSLVLGNFMLLLVLCYVGNFFRLWNKLWMWYNQKENNLFIISPGYSCCALISSFKYAVYRKYPGWHCTCCNQNNWEFLVCYVFYHHHFPPSTPPKKAPETLKCQLLSFP